MTVMLEKIQIVLFILKVVVPERQAHMDKLHICLTTLKAIIVIAYVIPLLFTPMGTLNNVVVKGVGI